MRFSEPSVLYFLSLAPLLYLALLLFGRNRLKEMEMLGDARMLERFCPAPPGKGYRVESLFIALSLFFFILSLARPQAGARLEPVRIRGSDIYIAIDVSKSMRAEDIGPHRFGRAKIIALELVKSLQGDRVGLILFGGDAFVQCPLTSDYDAVVTFLNSLDVSAAVASGTSIAAPLEAALDFIRPAEDTYSILLLLTDGEDTAGGWGRAMKALAKRSVKVFCIGIGTREGSPIPILDEAGKRTGYLKDSGGNVVISKLDDVALKEIAEKTHGYYFEAGRKLTEVGRFGATLANMKKRELETKRYTVYEERFQIPLAAGLILLILYMVRSVRAGRRAG